MRLKKKVSKSEREWLRVQRAEKQLIMARANERSFLYVVNQLDIPKVAFGSSLERETLPTSGPCMTPFMRRKQIEVRDFPGPAEYGAAKSLEKEFPSKLGFSVFASKIPRLLSTNVNHTPPIGSYDVALRRSFKQSAKPFGFGEKRIDREVFLTPGPPTYPHHIPQPQLTISSGFGSKRLIRPVVSIFCSPYNFSKCFKCGQMPYGDYWHNFATNTDLCRPCMHKELKIIKHCKTTVSIRMRMRHELDNFTPARYCGFFHDHNGTTAATQLITRKTLLHKIKQENYLSLYVKKP